MPAGVNSLMLLDSNCHVLSERLVFSNNSTWRLPLTITSPDSQYGLRDCIALYRPTKASTAYYSASAKMALTSLSSPTTCIPVFHEPLQAVKLQGLNPQATYTINEILLMPHDNSRKPTWHSKTYTSDYLMKIGLPILTSNDMSSRIIEITKHFKK